jgi:fibro-slime domain-containing protein
MSSASFLRVTFCTALLALVLSAAGACSFDKKPGAEGLSGGGTDASLVLADARGNLNADGTATVAGPDAAFTPADTGGYAIGGAPSGTGAGTVAGTAGCDTIVGVVRDFKGKNETNGDPDFEAFSGQGATTGLVQSQLGSDQKPVYASKCEAGVATSSTCPYGQQTTTKAHYDEWYRDTSGVNQPFILYLKFVSSGGVSTFNSSNFFPVDGVGWGNSGTGNDGKQHNYGFTTEVHTTFSYGGGEHFTFTGDDDLWVFINGHLAIDLGGLHTQLSSTIDLDASASTLGITKGNNYSMDLFHAERHTVASDFRVDTNLAFVSCGIIIP